jgi:prepilin-type N-terminal cleavage/methylation domain-containing protein
MKTDHVARFSSCNPPFRRRRAFTLVELLTVIVIIGILTGLMVAAAVPVRNLVRNWRMKSEITQMALSLERVRNDLGGGLYPPDSTNSNDFWQFFRRAFPRCSYTASNLPSGVTLPGTAAEALVFWLGGARDSNGNFIGFSSNPLNPFDTSGGTGTSTGAGRIGPFFDFDRTRVGPGSGGVNTPSSNAWNWVYYPQNDLTTPTTAPPGSGTPSWPYVYFKAVANAYPTTGYPTTGSNSAVPFADAVAMRQANVSGTNYIWVNPQSFQLLCPGLDGLYGATSGTAPLYPDGSNYGKNTFDDVTNFSRGKLESDMP